MHWKSSLELDSAITGNVQDSAGSGTVHKTQQKMVRFARDKGNNMVLTQHGRSDVVCNI